MSKNPFLPSKGKRRPEKRNSLDLSRQSLFTTDWGKLYPFFCQEVIPGDSFRIDSSVGFRAMQTKFPLQSRIRTSVSFFYVRNKNLWDGWEDFIFKSREGLVHPWLRVPFGSSRTSMFRTGGLADAFGLPTTRGSSSTQLYEGSFRSYYPIIAKDYSTDMPIPQTSWTASSLLDFLQSRTGQQVDTFILPYSIQSPDPTNYFGYFLQINLPDSFESIVSVTLKSSTTSTVSYSYVSLCLFWGRVGIGQESIMTLVSDITVEFTNGISTFSIPDAFIAKIKQIQEVGGGVYSFGISYVNNSGNPSFLVKISSYSVEYVGSNIVSDNTPFIGSAPQLPVSALPFRAYEQICNYYFRNDLNSPYILDGVAQYNEFIPTHDGGPDDNLYDFHYHNWELDRFVSALQTPQFGEAPLVGIQYSSDVEKAVDFTFQSTDSDTYTATLGVKDNQIVSIVKFDPDLPSSNLRKLMDMVNSGFSINALRDVNSFQRFLENCMRRGLRYRNQLMSHFGVSVDYPDIDVPEYIGGYSDWAQVGQVTNMAEMPDTGLGDYVGTLSGLSKSKHSINKYCPEHGFIIGLYCIYPVPVYSQSVEKYLLKSSPFDYFQTEFGKIGFAPIHYSEVSPLQTDEHHSLSDVFGYQKAWYDYMSSFDTAHGDFRTTLRDFLIQRLWDEPPVLSEDFVRVNPTQLNDVFTTRNIADAYGSNSRFLCSAICNVTALRPIPIHGMPSLE